MCFQPFYEDYLPCIGVKWICSLCGNYNPAVKCEMCNNQVFCAACNEMFHRHPKRHNHIRKVKVHFFEGFFFHLLNRRYCYFLAFTSRSNTSTIATKSCPSTATTAHRSTTPPTTTCTTDPITYALIIAIWISSKW